MAVTTDGGGSSAPDATAPTWTQLFTLLGVGSILTALITAELTRRRERRKWLDERRIEANREFHAAATTLAHTARDGFAKSNRNDVIDSLPGHHAVLVQRYRELILVGHPSVVAMAETVCSHLDVLATLALPPAELTHDASLKQREAALVAIDQLVSDLGMTMRIAAKFANHKQRKQFSRSNKDVKHYDRLTVSVVDQEGSAPPDIAKTLRDWRVISSISEETPSDLGGYKNQSPITMYDGGDFILGALTKHWTWGLWQFNMCLGNGPVKEQRMFEDVVRIVTGHGKAFEPKHAYQGQLEEWDREPNGWAPDEEVYVWTYTDLANLHPKKSASFGELPDSENPNKIGLFMKFWSQLGLPCRKDDADHLRIVAIRKSDTPPGNREPAWPVLGVHTRYRFELDVSRKLTTEEMESAQMLFNSSQFRYIPPTTITVDSTVAEMEERLPSILSTFAMARSNIRAGKQIAKMSQTAAAAETERVREALARMNAAIAADPSLTFEEHLRAGWEEALRNSIEHLPSERRDAVNGLLKVLKQMNDADDNDVFTKAFEKLTYEQRKTFEAWQEEALSTVDVSVERGVAVSASEPDAADKPVREQHEGDHPDPPTSPSRHAD